MMFDKLTGPFFGILYEILFDCEKIMKNIRPAKTKNTPHNSQSLHRESKLKVQSLF